MIARLGPFEPSAHLAVAVSGGADSMALCLIAADWVPPALRALILGPVYRQPLRISIQLADGQWINFANSLPPWVQGWSSLALVSALSMALAVHLPIGVVMHTGDYRLDPGADGRPPPQPDPLERCGAHGRPPLLLRFGYG